MVSFQVHHYGFENIQVLLMSNGSATESIVLHLLIFWTPSLNPPTQPTKILEPRLFLLGTRTESHQRFHRPVMQMPSHPMIVSSAYR